MERKSLLTGGKVIAREGRLKQSLQEYLDFDAYSNIAALLLVARGIP